MDEEFKFLNLILQRKKQITKQFLIGVYSSQKSDTDYITDNELEPIIEDIVIDVFSSLGPAYKKFLIEKYFGSEETLIKFISEDVYVDLVTDTINRNTKKIQIGLQKRLMTRLNDLNKQE